MMEVNYSSRRSLSFVLAGLFFVGFVGCDRNPDKRLDTGKAKEYKKTNPSEANKRKQLDEAESKKPFVFIHMTPALSSVIKCGVIAAVWNDGQIIRTRSEADIGSVYVKGKLSPADLARIKQLLLQCSPKNLKINGIVVDSAADFLVIRFTSGVEHKDHSPPNTNDPEIAQVRNELMSLAIENPSEIDGAPYKAWPGDWYK